jgi:hypothetical protein
MHVFRVHRMKEAPRQQFRWAPHVAGTANVRPKDYDPSSEVEAEDEYAAWARLRNSDTPLHVGDLLEDASGRLRICKYVGFEDAQWLLPAPAADVMAPPAVAAPAMASLPSAQPR